MDDQLRAAQLAYDNACDCCDHKPIARRHVEREPGRDSYREWAGIEAREDRELSYNGAIRPGHYPPNIDFEGMPF